MLCLGWSADILPKIKTEKKLPYLTGDFNIDLLNVENHLPSQEFINLMYSHSVFPYITKPSRVTTHSATLIDNIFASNIGDNAKTLSGLLYTDITDHFPVFYIDYSSAIQNEAQFVRRRVFSSQNISKFSTALETVDWSAVSASNDPQEAYTLFHTQFVSAYNEGFPLKSEKK